MAVDALLKEAFKLPPQDALEYLQGKGYALSWNWWDLYQEAHAKAFTVAKVAQLDILEDIRGELLAAMDGQSTERDFVRALTPKLKAKGWWGRLPLLDDAGEAVLAPDGTPRTYQAGSPWRLKTIFRTNKRTAFAAGRWRAFENAAKLRPYLQYIAIMDSRVREQHAALNGRIFAVTDPIWKTHAPPNGWNCRCRLRSLSEAAIKRRGLQNKVSNSQPGDFQPVEQTLGVDRITGEEVSGTGVRWTDPVTGDELLPDAGWSYNPGKPGADQLNKLLAAKAKAAAEAAEAQAKAAKTAAGKAAAAAAAAALKELAKAVGTDALAARQAAAAAAAAQAGAAAAQAQAKAALAALAKAEGQAALARSLAKVGERAAQAQLDAIAGAKAGGANTFLKAAYKDMAGGKGWDAMSAKDKLESVQDIADAMKAEAAIKAGLTNYKKWVLAGKPPTAAQKAALAKLDPAEQQAFLNELATVKAAADAAELAAKTAAAKVPAPPPPAALNFADLEQIGAQAGSNPGGLFRHKTTGEAWYIKVPQDADRARNEVLTAQLYRAAGVEAPEYATLTINGRIGAADYQGAFGIASKIIPDVSADAAALKAGRVAGVGEGFAADAWLANWDVVGLGFDNLLVRAGRAVRVDTGGGLIYRAQGTAKGAAFGPRVTELDSFLDPAINPQAAEVFRHATREQLEAGAAKILAIPDADIRRLVDQYGPGDAAARQALADTLLARKQDLAARFPAAARKAAAQSRTPAAGADAVLSADELARIRAARVNGYSRPSDGGEIEDQNVLLWTEQAADGAEQARAYLKLREAAETRLMDEIRAATGAMPDMSDAGTFEAAVTAVKGIASNFTAGNPLRAVDIQRVQAARAAYDARLAALAKLDQGAADSFRAQFGGWIDALERAVAPGEGRLAAWAAPAGQLAPWTAPALPMPALPPGARAWRKEAGTFERAELDRGAARRTGERTEPWGHKYVTELPDGTRVEYWPDEPDVPWALRRRMEITARGTDAARPVTALEELGIDARRATALDREELYLRRIAYHRRDDDILAAADATADQAARVEQLKNSLNARVGRDITRTGAYLPDGEHQAFGHGRNVQFRPDLEGDPDWTRFQRDYRLHHTITQGDLADSLERIINGGGQMAPTTDKLRRGIPIGGMSAQDDLGTGGANYFFTRIQTAGMARARRGLVWRSRLVGRLDAISYDSDLFGDTGGGRYLVDGKVNSRRKTGMAEWREAASSNPTGNETIFKDSLSLFDDLESINAGSAAERDGILQMLRRNGYTVWPDGRALEDVVRIAK